MSGAIPPLPQYAFMAWCLVKHKDTFTFVCKFQLASTVSRSAGHTVPRSSLRVGPCRKDTLWSDGSVTEKGLVQMMKLRVRV
jgi:hypothetical protein